jgi:hypothetical protein
MKILKQLGKNLGTFIVSIGLVTWLPEPDPLLAAGPGFYLWTSSGHTGAVYGTAFSSDGNYFITASDDMTVKIWDASNGTLIRTLTGATGAIRGVAISPDGTLVAAGSADRKVRIWRFSDGVLLYTMIGHTNNIRSVAFSPDGTRLVSGSDDRTAKIWNTTTGTLVRTLSGHTNYVVTVAWSPDGTMIATGSCDNTIRIWNASTGALIRTLTGHTNYVNRVEFSNDSATLVSASHDNTIKFWNVATGAVRCTRTCGNPVLSASYSPDNTYVLGSDTANNILFTGGSDCAAVNGGYTESSTAPSPKYSPNGRYIGYGRTDNLVCMANSPVISPSCFYITTYNLWRSCKFTPAEQADDNISGPNADPDGDGVPNLMEYAMGTNPKAPSPEAVMNGSVIEDFPTLTYRKNVTATDLVFEVGGSSDLQNWDYSSTYLDSLLTIDQDVCLATVKDYYDVAHYTTRYYKLRVTWTGGAGGVAFTPAVAVLDNPPGLTINRFHQTNEVSQWRWDYGSAPRSFAWDSGQDASGSSASGSLKLVANFNAALGVNNRVALTRDYASPGTNLSGYYHIQMDVKVAPGSPVSVAGDGGNGYLSLAIRNTASYNYVAQYAANLFSSNGWTHIDAPLVAPVDQVRGFTVELYGGPGQNLTGTTTLWVDNLVILPTNSPPYIFIHPASCTNQLGGTATFSVAAAGAPPLAYHWIKNQTNYLANGGNVSNATTATLNLANLAPPDAGTYRVLVTNLYGSTISFEAQLTMVPAPDLGVLVNGTNLLSGVGAADFGGVSLGQTNVLTLAITNAGTSNLIIGALSLTGADAGNYAVNTNGMATNVAPGAATSFTVQLTPATAGPKTALLHIASNDPDTNPYDVGLTGVGLDSVAPSIGCPPDVTVTADAGQCDASGVGLGTPTATDDSGSVSVTSNAPAQYAVGTNMVTWTASDPSGNTNSCTQLVIVEDTQPPTLTCPADVTISADAGQCYGSSVPLGIPAVTDNCTLASVTSNAPAQFPIGTNAVTWTATDGSGNSNTCAQVVIVRDTQPPGIACAPDVTVDADSGQGYATGVVLGTPGTSDNCGVASVVSNTPVQFPIGTNLVTWTATDPSGNANACTQAVIVCDTQPPSITCPADVTVSADTGQCSASGVGLGTPAASDNSGSLTVTSNAPAQYAIGTNTVTWTAIDPSGHTNSCTQLVVVYDTEPPVLTCPENVTVNADAGQCYATGVALGVPIGTDNCSLASVTSNAPAQFPVGTNTVTWIATDVGGNTNTCAQLVIVGDTQPPNLTCPPDVTVDADAGEGYASLTNIVMGMPMAADQCSGVTVSSNAPVQFPVGTNAVTWTATDSSGNTNSCPQLVIVRDVEPPAILYAFTNLTLATTGTNCQALLLDLTGTNYFIAADACSPSVTLTQSPPAGAWLALGTNEVVLTALDDSGNATNSTNAVLVVDTSPPVVTLNGSDPLTVECHASFTDPGATAFDNCAGTVPVTDSGNVDANSTGAYTLTYTADDGSGNTNSRSRTVNVVDTTAPTIVFAFTNLTLGSTSTNCQAQLPDLTGTNYLVAVDACNSSVTVTQNPAAGTRLPLGTNEVVLSAVDPSGNVANSTNAVLVVDIAPPIVTLNGSDPLTVECHASFTDPGATAFDDCAGVVPVTVSGNVDANSTGAYTLTYTADDGSGNTNSRSRTINVVDTTAPAIVFAFTNLTLSAITNCQALLPDLTGTNHFIALDACSGSITVTQDPPAGAWLGSGTNEVVLTAFDAWGNSVRSTNTVTVVDTTQPVMACPADVTVSADAGQCYATGVALGTPIANDNCSLAGVASNAPAQFPVGTNTVTWTATDASGNTNSCAQLVVVRMTPGSLLARLLPDKNVALLVERTCDQPFSLEVSINLVDWETLTNYLDPAGTVACLDLCATNFPQRFYRAVWP